MKGFISKKFVLFILIVGVGVFLTFYFIKKVGKSNEKVALESANAIYDSANTYYVNTMMLLGIESYECSIKDDGCEELNFVSTTKPKNGYISIYMGDVNAKLEYKDINYFICNNVVTKDEDCFIEQYKKILSRSINNYYTYNLSLNKEDFEKYYCNFDNKKCDDSFNKIYENKGEVLIDKNGIIEASLEVLNNKFYICNDLVKDDNECLIDISINKIIKSLENYHKENNKNKGYNGLECDIKDCDIEYISLYKPSGSVSLTKTGKINAKLIYDNQTYYICNSKQSDKECNKE